MGRMGKILIVLMKLEESSKLGGTGGRWIFVGQSPTRTNQVT